MYEEECEVTYSYGKQCKKVPMEKCEYETVEKCQLEPKKKCRTIYKTECQKVPRKVVETVINCFKHLEKYSDLCRLLITGVFGRRKKYWMIQVAEFSSSIICNDFEIKFKHNP